MSEAECGDFERRNEEETTYGAYEGPSCLWRSIGGSVVQLLKEDGEVWPSVGLRSLWRSVVAMTVHPAGSSWSLEKWSSTQIPRVEVFWNEDPRLTVVPMTVRHTCRWGEWREQQKKLLSMGRRSPWRSVAWSVDPAAFWQISNN